MQKREKCIEEEKREQNENDERQENAPAHWVHVGGFPAPSHRRGEPGNSKAAKCNETRLNSKNGPIEAQPRRPAVFGQPTMLHAGAGYMAPPKFAMAEKQHSNCAENTHVALRSCPGPRPVRSPPFSAESGK